MRKLQSTRNAHHRQKNGSKGANSEVPTEGKRQPGHSCENNVRDKSSDETSEEFKLIPTTSPCFSRMVTPRRLQHWQEVINAASDRAHQDCTCRAEHVHASFRIPRASFGPSCW